MELDSPCCTDSCLSGSNPSSSHWSRWFIFEIRVLQFVFGACRTLCMARCTALQLSLSMGHGLNRSDPSVHVNLCGQVGYIDPSLVKSRNLSQVGQVRPADSSGQVRNIDPSGSKWQAYLSSDVGSMRHKWENKRPTRLRWDGWWPEIDAVCTCLLWHIS